MRRSTEGEAFRIDNGGFAMKRKQRIIRIVTAMLALLVCVIGLAYGSTRALASPAEASGAEAQIGGWSSTGVVSASVTIAKQPKNVTTYVGNTVTFTVSASGSGTLKYQWQTRASASSAWKNSTSSSAKTAKFSITVQGGHNGYQFRCVVTDGSGATATTDAAKLTVRPKITTQPKGKTVSVGSSLTLTVAATGAGTLSYQWQTKAPNSNTWKNSASAYAKTAKFTTKAQGGHQGYQFRCVVTDGNGNAVVSDIAQVFLVNIPVTATYFPDATFRNYVSSNFDKDKNGTLNTTELQAAKKIDVPSMGIETLAGVEFFTKLEYLDCSGEVDSVVDESQGFTQFDYVFNGNYITSLNLSCNTELTFLHCSRNLLTKLDVSRNVKLETLGCSGLRFYDSATKTFYEYRLRTLDVSNNTELTLLECADNLLTDLDLRNNTKLEQLNCNNNRLTFLYVAKCPKMTLIYCNDNRLTSLNLTGCPLLETLYCSFNSLTSLNLKKNKELRRLKCECNNLKTLDVSGCQYLTMNCGGNLDPDLSENCGHRSDWRAYNLSPEDVKTMEAIVESLITENMNRVEQIKAIHDWIVLNVSYDYTYKQHRADEVLNDHIAVCSGYSELFCAFMEMLRIPCYEVVGGNHAWDIVRLEDGMYYQVDCTWDDEGDSVSYGYFLIGIPTMVKYDRQHHVSIYGKYVSLVSFEDYDWRSCVSPD